MAVEWVEPPTRGSSGNYEPFVAELKANPGRWAKFPSEYVNDSTVYARRIGILRGRPRAFSGSRWEALVRNKELYVRYLGPVDTD